MKKAQLTRAGVDMGIRVSIADTPLERMRGLLGRDGLARDEALLLCPCRSVHTFGMRFAIDVLFLDRHGRLVALHADTPARRLLFNFHATQTLEMPAGTAHGQAIKTGDVFAFEALL
ncbi:DUF192 domain-containing protein [Paraburkholderia gardini]|uniref:DUF192 domain-containing protein n=1 Tax=Paraburkholderia gardini TaxID=2823469 RepID=A0ABM8U3H5_9BURK|nr:DUF192 domain-containing protein [Paraburkholderia gardini]CAG4898191.1 hypothetical protein R69919_02430 [Paraburkholderia gardini]CAG4898633.1 hypothetical protein R54767_02417 [Paraburkholderia gardini]